MVRNNKAEWISHSACIGPGRYKLRFGFDRGMFLTNTFSQLLCIEICLIYLFLFFLGWVNQPVLALDNIAVEESICDTTENVGK